MLSPSESSGAVAFLRAISSAGRESRRRRRPGARSPGGRMAFLSLARSLSLSLSLARSLILSLSLSLFLSLSLSLPPSLSLPLPLSLSFSSGGAEGAEASIHRGGTGPSAGQATQKRDSEGLGESCVRPHARAPGPACSWPGSRPRKPARENSSPPAA